MIKNPGRKMGLNLANSIESHKLLELLNTRSLKAVMAISVVIYKLRAS